MSGRDDAKKKKQKEICEEITIEKERERERNRKKWKKVKNLLTKKILMNSHEEYFTRIEKKKLLGYIFFLNVGKKIFRIK